MTTTAAPLFGGSTRGASNKNLVEFRAGKMQLKSNNMVHPDKRKGLVYIYQSEDSLMHFCWKDRTSGTVEDDLIIFPDDIEYKKISECSTGRVFLLKFKSNNRKFFFWMQEPKSDKDEDYCTKVNEYLNNPPTAGSNSGERDLHSLLNNMDQQQLMQLFGNTQQLTSLLGAGRGSGVRERMRERFDRENRRTSTTSSTTTTTTTTTSASPVTTPTTASTTSPVTTPTTSTTTRPIQLTDLQNILQGITVPPAATPTQQAELGTAFNAETLQPILSNSEFLERLRPFLPNTGEEAALPTADQLKDTVHSPQFQQAMSLFSVALASGQLGPLMQQFDLGEDAVAAAKKGDMEAFLKALQSKKPEEKKEDKDESME